MSTTTRKCLLCNVADISEYPRIVTICADCEREAYPNLYPSLDSVPEYPTVPQPATVTDYAAHLEGTYKDGLPFKRTWGQCQYSGWALDEALTTAARLVKEQGMTITVVAVMKRESVVSYTVEHVEPVPSTANLLARL